MSLDRKLHLAPLDGGGLYIDIVEENISDDGGGEYASYLNLNHAEAVELMDKISQILYNQINTI